MELIKGLRLKKKNVTILRNADGSFYLTIYYKKCKYGAYYNKVTISNALDKFIIYVKKCQNN